MNKRAIDEMISFFNQEVSKMDISQENKMKLLGMITAIGYENKKQDVVRCRECKWWINGMCYSDNFILRFEEVKPDWYCADGERRDDA